MESKHMIGVCFEPYVGPWDGSQPVLFNTYTLDQVTDLLKPVAKKFSLIRTYGQGTFVWEGTPRIQDSNQYNIAAAKAAGLDVVAGCYQQGADPGGDSINTAWTQTEIDFAIQQAHTHGNVVGLTIGNECIWGPHSTNQITQLIKYAKTKRKALGFDETTLPVTTVQEWGVLAGVHGGPQASEIKTMLSECEGAVYANVYPYFDPNIAAKLTGVSKDQFVEIVTDSFTGSVTALGDAFSAAGVTLPTFIGETGWPWEGTQPAQPAAIATKEFAQWYWDAAQSFLGEHDFYFEAFCEPWKGHNSEAYFGLWEAEGSSTEPGNYTLTGEKAIITV
jgi:exo-beta-1,3-glucanase (GH17 family)